MSSIPARRNTRTTADWQELDRLHFRHPFTDYKALGEKGSRVITRADGVYLWDSDGNKILDGMAGLWCVNIGYGRQELVDAAAEQMRELPYYNSFFQTAHPPAIELSSLLAEVTPPGLNQVFFTNSGSEANDTVIRLVRHYWAAMGKPGKTLIVSRENAYHGSTMGGASLGGMKPMHEQGGLPIPGIEHIAQPYWFKEGQDMTPDEFGVHTARALERKIEELGVDKVAAFIAEPIQGAGGVIIPPETYWPEISRICKERDILLVVDEVICGFGRIGKWFGSDYYDLAPDLMPIAKGLSSGYLPIGGVMIADHVADVLIEKGGEFRHGFTYSGHPAACAVAIANINILRDNRIVDQVDEKTGPYLQRRWAELGDHPLVAEARGLGFLGALELAIPQGQAAEIDAGVIGSLCRDFCFNEGLVMRAVEDTMIISPPLIMTKEQIDELVRLASRCLDLTASELGVG